MAAVTAARDTKFYGDKRLYPEALTIKTSESIYQGALVALDANGLVVDATKATGEGPYFIASETVLSAAAGTKTYVWEGTVGLENGESITVADIGATAYLDDNQTALTTSADSSAIGTIKFIGAADSKVYVVLNGAI